MTYPRAPRRRPQPSWWQKAIGITIAALFLALTITALIAAIYWLLAPIGAALS